MQFLFPKYSETVKADSIEEAQAIIKKKYETPIISQSISSKK